MRFFKTPASDFGSLVRDRSGFLLSVYGLLFVQLLITYAVVLVLRKHPDVYAKIHKFVFLWFVLGLVLILTIGLAPIPAWLKLVLFTCFSVVLGFNMLAASTKVGDELVRAALMGALGIFVVMSLIGFALAGLGVNLSFMQFAMTVALLGLIIGMLIAWLMRASSKVVKAILVVSVVLFSVFVSVDTNTMLMDVNSDVVMSAVRLYLDVINLFQDLVGLGSLK
jgi:FtsH-binding integral membrane protein